MTEHPNDMPQVKRVDTQDQWGVVAKELEAENLKLMSYDKTLLSLFGDVHGKKVLDYGAGPGVLAFAIKKMGGETKVYDISPDMRQKAAEKIGDKNVYKSVDEIPEHSFDVIVCNLVLCIVPEEQTKSIVDDIKHKLSDTGAAYIGFCNPRIFDVAESDLDYRFPTGQPYEEPHQYKKIKKEGGYEIIETHRPMEWYENVFKEAGLKLVSTSYTPEYNLKGKDIKDFVIYKVTK